MSPSPSALRAVAPDSGDVAPAAPVPAIKIGRVVAVSGGQAVVSLNERTEAAPEGRAEIGAVLTIATGVGDVVGIVSGLSIPAPVQDDQDGEFRIVEIELAGEITASDEDGERQFRRGISAYPSLGDPVCIASHADLEIVFAPRDGAAIKIGGLHQDGAIDAHVITDELLAKHFAVLGSTGAGKSCAVALILRRILEEHRHAHVVVLDPHNEYAAAFGDLAEAITPETLQIPFWMLTFDELLEVIFPAGEERRGVEVEVLRELIPAAKQHYREPTTERARSVRRADAGGAAAQLSVDTPVPYKISDLTALVDEHMGKLERTYDVTPYKRLKARLQTLSSDPRYAFMFGGLTVNDVMQDVVARIFRVPTDGRPLTVLDLSTVPTEVMNAVVSVVCRLAFELAVWSDRTIPVTIVCEEAHRYIPRDSGPGGAAAATRSIARISREGRKYGVSLCVVSQRPSELAPTILSQSSTVFAMRLTNRLDQDIVRSAVTDASASLFEFLPSLGNGEAIVIGEGVRAPMRVRFERLPADSVPRSQDAQFSKLWSAPRDGATDLAAVIDRWRFRTS